MRSFLPHEPNTTFYSLIEYPEYGQIMLNALPVRAFTKECVDNGLIRYERNAEYVHDYLQDMFVLGACPSKGKCEGVIRIHVDMLPLLEEAIVSDVSLNSTFIELILPPVDLSSCSKILKVTMRPVFGELLLDNVPAMSVRVDQLASGKVAYRRSEQNVSNDDIAFGGGHCKLVYRLVVRPLVRLKKIYVPYGKAFILHSRLVDTTQLEKSIRRLALEGILKSNTDVKQHLQFSFPNNPLVGYFTNGNHSSYGQTEMTRFSYSDLAAGRVTFNNFLNASVGTIIQIINATVSASGLMSPTLLPLRISIVSSHYAGQDNILLSDSGDELNQIDTKGKSTKLSEIGVSARLKIGLAATVGLICSILCVCVVAAYFLLRRWRRKQRLEAPPQYDRVVYVEPHSPQTINSKSAIARPDSKQPASLLLVSLPAPENEPITSIYVSEPTSMILTSGGNASPVWGRKSIDAKTDAAPSRGPSPASAFCFIPSETLTHLKGVGGTSGGSSDSTMQTVPCYVSSAGIKSGQIRQEQPLCNCHPHV